MRETIEAGCDCDWLHPPLPARPRSALEVTRGAVLHSGILPPDGCNTARHDAKRVCSGGGRGPFIPSKGSRYCCVGLYNLLLFRNVQCECVWLSSLVWNSRARMSRSFASGQFIIQLRVRSSARFPPQAQSLSLPRSRNALQLNCLGFPLTSIALFTFLRGFFLPRSQITNLANKNALNF